MTTAYGITIPSDSEDIANSSPGTVAPPQPSKLLSHHSYTLQATAAASLPPPSHPERDGTGAALSATASAPDDKRSSDQAASPRISSRATEEGGGVPSGTMMSSGIPMTLPPPGQGPTFPGFGETGPGPYHYTTTSSDSDFQYGEDFSTIARLEREKKERKAAAAEVARKRRMRMHQSVGQLLAILPASKDSGVDNIVARAVEYVAQLRDSVESAQLDNNKLSEKLQQLTAEGQTNEGGQRQGKVTRLWRVRSKKEVAVSTLRITLPMLMALTVIASVVSPQLLLRQIWGFRHHLHIDAIVARLPNTTLELTVPFADRLKGVVRFMSVVLTVLIVRRIKKVAAVVGWCVAGLLGEVPKRDDECGNCPTPHTSPPALPSQPSTGAHWSSSASGGEGLLRTGTPPPLSPSRRPTNPTRGKAKSKVMAYLHSEGIEARGRLIPRYSSPGAGVYEAPHISYSGGYDVGAHHESRRHTFNCGRTPNGAHNTPYPLPSSSSSSTRRSRTLSNASTDKAHGHPSGPPNHRRYG
eukprot:Sspe_Gene.95042::Locus_67380_Transcript_1_1_Confidence_1.000_Length_1791::g.95042::m.95042